MSGSYPKTDREARARIKRKLKALKRSSWALLIDAAGLWEEGVVSADIDRLLEDIDRGIDAIHESLDEELERHELEAQL